MSGDIQVGYSLNTSYFHNLNQRDEAHPLAHIGYFFSIFTRILGLVKDILCLVTYDLARIVIRWGTDHLKDRVTTIGKDFQEIKIAFIGVWDPVVAYHLDFLIFDFTSECHLITRPTFFVQEQDVANWKPAPSRKDATVPMRYEIFWNNKWHPCDLTIQENVDKQ